MLDTPRHVVLGAKRKKDQPERAQIVGEDGNVRRGIAAVGVEKAERPQDGEEVTTDNRPAGVEAEALKGCGRIEGVDTTTEVWKELFATRRQAGRDGLRGSEGNCRGTRDFLTSVDVDPTRKRRTGEAQRRR